MREIKFRIWNKSAKIMIYPGDKCDAFINLNGNLVTSIMEDCIDEVPKDMYELMRFTGLYSYDKKPIFEDDVLDWSTGDKAIVQFNRKGYWEDCNFYEGSKIIGNIWENKDLLCEK